MSDSTLRLPGHDYKTPGHYLITMKLRDDVPPLCKIHPPSETLRQGLEQYFTEAVRAFHLTCDAVEPIRLFVVMPDHIHMIFQLRANENNLGVEEVVGLVMKCLDDCYRKFANPQRTETIFAPAWRDRVLRDEDESVRFSRYIYDSHRRRWFFATHPEFTSKANKLFFLGRHWWAYGNAQLARVPYIDPVMYGTDVKEGDEIWTRAVARAKRLGTGSVGIGPFTSACEKACGRVIGEAGGRWIVLTPVGMGPGWKPLPQFERFCRSGHMLFLSLYDASRAPLSMEECIERNEVMNEAVRTGLRAAQVAAADAAHAIAAAKAEQDAASAVKAAAAAARAAAEAAAKAAAEAAAKAAAEAEQAAQQQVVARAEAEVAAAKAARLAVEAAEAADETPASPDQMSPEDIAFAHE